MRQPIPGHNGTALARLVAQVDRLTHDLADLTRIRDDVAAHSRSLADLSDLLRRLTTSPATAGGAGADAAAGPPEWLTVTDPSEAVAWLADLHQWVADVWIHYTLVPPCWPWHPAVVADLLTCRRVWGGAVAAGAPVTELAAWHDRWRPGTAARIGRLMTACERADSSHVDRAGRRYFVDSTVLDELAVWWATTHATASPPPGLTPEDRR